MTPADVKLVRRDFANGTSEPWRPGAFNAYYIVDMERGLQAWSPGATVAVHVRLVNGQLVTVRPLVRS